MNHKVFFIFLRNARRLRELGWGWVDRRTYLQGMAMMAWELDIRNERERLAELLKNWARPGS